MLGLGLVRIELEALFQVRRPFLRLAEELD
jgi:hypothetical protein